MKTLKLKSIYDIYSLYQITNGYSLAQAYQSYHNIFSIFKQNSNETEISVLDIGAGTGHFSEVAQQVATSLGLKLKAYYTQDKTPDKDPITNKSADIVCDIYDLSSNPLLKEHPVDLAILVHNVMNCAVAYHNLTEFLDQTKSVAGLVINQCARKAYWQEVAEEETIRGDYIFVNRDAKVIEDLGLPKRDYIFNIEESVYLTSTYGLYKSSLYVEVFDFLTKEKVMIINVEGKNDIQCFDSLPISYKHYVSGSSTLDKPVLYDVGLSNYPVTLDYNYFVYGKNLS